MPGSVDTFDSFSELCTRSEAEVLALGEPPAGSNVLLSFTGEVARRASKSDPPKSRCTSDSYESALRHKVCALITIVLLFLMRSLCELLISPPCILGDEAPHNTEALINGLRIQ